MDPRDGVEAMAAVRLAVVLALAGGSVAEAAAPKVTRPPTVALVKLPSSTAADTTIGPGPNQQVGLTGLLRPFPVVRIRGRLTPSGALVTLLTVTAPRGTRISLRCRGGNCPARRWALTTVLTHLTQLERRFQAGTQLEIAVTRPGMIGKYTSIVIRRGRPPLRRDGCLYPGSRGAAPCLAR